jgi:mannosidase alpha-like ER degradation enhancer 2
MRLLSLALVLLTACAARTPPVASTRPVAPTQAQVRAEIAFAWDAYRRLAWGHDELRPLSRAPHDWYAAPLLMTPVDSLDTLLLAGLDAQAADARALIVERLSFDHDISVKTFEVTIRLLGGLLSGYQLTGDRRLLALAEDLGRRLLPAFASPTGMPYVNVNLRTGAVSGAESNPAEVGTLLLEFGTLARLTGQPIFYDRAKGALVALHQRRSKLGLVGERINVDTGAWTSGDSHVGGGIDSYYEYLLKGWLLFGDEDCRRMWQESLAALNAHLADETPGGLWYGVVDMSSGQRRGTTFGALHAFLPAVLALGGDLPRARRLQESAFSMWTLAGIEPEVLDYRRMAIVHPGYQLRPEIVESAYTLHHLTHDPRYRQMGATFFAELVRHCRTADGYTVLKSVVTREKGDRMHSFLLAETFKYLYLLFSPDQALDLGKVVFNTEAHPLRRTW